MNYLFVFSELTIVILLWWKNKYHGKIIIFMTRPPVLIVKLGLFYSRTRLATFWDK